MNFAEMGWPEITVFTIGAIFILAGVAATLVDYHRTEKTRARLARFDARVGRDVYTDRSGLTKR